MITDCRCTALERQAVNLYPLSVTSALIRGHSGAPINELKKHDEHAFMRKESSYYRNTEGQKSKLGIDDTITELKEPIQSEDEMQYRSSHSVWDCWLSSSVVLPLRCLSRSHLGYFASSAPSLLAVAGGAPSVQNLSHNFSVAHVVTCNFIAQLLGANESGRN
jgi:hypothetical protein